ncbi:MAG TPA: crossover junction endodeoxyribonuclease RuvC, partial [Rhodothermales bacterium]|nr:crossover junction endodeoxyribonuclease RuvC [Rhodothermales bacterium]
MLILGIDPGSNHTGYGLVEAGRGPERLVTCGVLDLDARDDHGARLLKINERMGALIETHHPDEVAVEMPIFGRDPQALLKLGRAQAAAMLAALQRGLPVTQYTPAEVKKAVTGNGNATKEAVYRMVQALLKLDTKVGFDATDALAVALCHLNQGRAGSVQASGGGRKRKGAADLLAERLKPA